MQTASIRPLSSPTKTLQRQSAPVHLHHSSSAAKTQRTMTSIRPLSASGTPTATVVPPTIHEPLQQQQQADMHSCNSGKFLVFLSSLCHLASTLGSGEFACLPIHAHTPYREIKIVITSLTSLGP